MPEVIKLVKDRVAIEVEPDRGGSLRSFQYQRRNGTLIDIFQNVNTAPPGSWGYFIMAPYTARIFNGVITWNDLYFAVSPVKNSLHAIHGPGRQHPWTVSVQGANYVSLRLCSADYPETFAYPSALEMTLIYSLNEATLNVQVQIKNVGQCDAPIGGGSHPFIPKLLAGCTRPPVLTFSAAERFLPRSDTPGEAMPDGRTEPMVDKLSFEKGRTPEDGWDHCLRVWRKGATAFWEDIGLCLTFLDNDPKSEGFAHLWYPGGRDVWAFEQQIAIGNAFNLAQLGFATGMRILKPGETTGFDHSFAVTES